MAAEQYTNAGATTLSGNGGSIDSSVTTFSVASGTPLPSSGPFRALCGTELMIVGAISGTTVSSVTRGAEGTSAASHNDGDAFAHVLTAYSLSALQLLSPKLALGDPTGLFNTWVNQGSATVDESAGDVLLGIASGGGGGNARMRTKACPGSTPWQADFALIADMDLNEATGGWVAIGMRESTGGKLLVCRLMFDSGPAPTMWFENRSAPNTTAGSFSGTSVITRNLLTQQGPLYLRLKDDGTNLLGYLSLTAGRTWRQLFTTTRANYLGTPDQIFIGVSASSSFDTNLLLLGYGES